MFRYGSCTDFETLKGMTFATVQQINGFDDNDAVRFTTEDGREFELTHRQDCCEHVYIESIIGELSDLEGSEILLAEESSNSHDDEGGDYDDNSHTWTFYKLATSKGYVDIRFYGSSNGYYGESASLYEMEAR